MDPVTHAIIGMTLSKMTGNSVELANAINVSIITGSVFPDIDILFQKWGDYAYLKNHRGVSHSIIGNFVSAAFITLILVVVFRSSNVFGIFFGALLGLLSHCVADLLNCFGAKLLWPFYKKKISFGLFMSFDPILLVLLSGYIFTDGRISIYFISFAVAYFFLRLLMKNLSILNLQKHFGDEYSISLLPSLGKPFKWHFILETDDYNIVGEKSAIRSKLKLYKSLEKIDKDEYEKALVSPVGKFFSDFTPFCHVSCKKEGENTKYIFSDMRFFYKNDFLHHATMELDESECIVNSTFNPYKMNRENDLPFNTNQNL